MLGAQVIAATFSLVSCFAMLCGEASAQQSTWSRAASVLDLSCAPTAPKFLSPDQHFMAEVRCSLHHAGDPTYSLRLHAGKKQIAELPLAEGTQEIVWSPDSHAFFLNGGETAVAEFFVKVYTIDEQGRVLEHNVTSSAQRDMVDAFPPCKGANHDDDCKRIEDNPKYNMSGLAWTPDSKAIFVFAEIPCSILYGAIKCQARGYEIDVASGQILERLSAQQVKQRWQALAAWDIKVPDPPVYGAGETH